MNQKRLDEIRARVEAATPGPWMGGYIAYWHKCQNDCAEPQWWNDEPGHNIVRVIEPGIGVPKDEIESHVIAGNYDHGSGGIVHTNDLQFIAHARQDVPALLAEIERLRDAARESATICRFQQKMGYAETCDDKVYASWSRWTEYFEAIAAGRDVKSPCRVPH